MLARRLSRHRSTRRSTYRRQRAGASSEAPFTAALDETGQDIRLVLIGRSNLELPSHPDIIPLGFVSEEDKFDAIRAADVLMMPSLYESLSLVIMEAWLMEVPTLVNGHCEVLKFQSRRSNGGLYYYTYDEFATGPSA